MPNFLILQKFQTSSNKTKTQKRDFSNFNSDDFFSDLNNMRIQQQIINSISTNTKYNIFHDH